MTTEINAIILLILGIIGCVVGILTYIGAIQTKSKNDGMLEQKLNELSKQIEKLLGQNDRLVIVEQSLATAWKRIDEHTCLHKQTAELLNDIEKRCAVKHGER